jgi:hypothetical protein
MARSLLRSFVTGARQMLAAQLVVSIGAVALAGWTLNVTNDLIRERERLKERVIQLEQTMAEQGLVVPSAPATVDRPSAPATDAYPPAQTGAPPTATAALSGERADAPAAESSAPPPPAAQDFNPAQIIGEAFAPPPPLRTLVLHVRTESDAPMAAQIARSIGERTRISATVNIMQPGDPRQSGYAYYDGRQSRAAAAIVAQFNDDARRYDLAAWSAQLRGVALPAQADYSADRLDIVLPPLPAPPTAPQQIDPRAAVAAPPRPR